MSDQDNDKAGSGSASGEDYTDDEEEGEEGYKPGGYHPVKVGEAYNQRYDMFDLWVCLVLDVAISNTA
jgi:serine/threonine-protein kinase SRPK3